MQDSGIYLIMNQINGKGYIGQTINFSKRFNEHKRMLMKDNHPNKHLQSAWNKYGSNNFVFLILEQCDFNKTILDQAEQFWIDFFNTYYNGYNQTIGGDFNPSMNPKIAQKISKSQQGEKHWNYGQKTPKNTKKKISQSVSRNKNTSGYYNVSKRVNDQYKNGFIWRYTYQDNNKRKEITSTNITKLKEKVLAKGLLWKEFR